jgi:integrase
MAAKYFEDWKKTLSEKTRPIYRTGWEVFIEYFREERGEKTTPDKLLRIMIEDRKKPLEDQGEIEKAHRDWIRWLETDYTNRVRGRGKGKLKKKGIGANTIKLYNTAVRSFFSYYGYPLSKKAKLPRHIRLSNGKLENTKIEYRPEQVKRLLSVIKSHRDKAICLIMFQSGMDISTACSLNYGDIEEGFERMDKPLMVHVQRKKIGLNYRTFLGHDSIEAIETYLNERVNKYGEKMTYETPLFVTEGTHVNKRMRCKPKLFRSYVVLAGLVSKAKMKRADFSPARPHALRASFATIARLKGLNEKLIDYFMGHSDPYGGAYNQATNKELRDKYMEIEEALSVSSVSNLSDIEGKLKEELKQRDFQIKGMEDRLKELEQDFKTLKELVQWEKSLKSR